MEYLSVSSLANLCLVYHTPQSKESGAFVTLHAYSELFAHIVTDNREICEASYNIIHALLVSKS